MNESISLEERCRRLYDAGMTIEQISAWLEPDGIKRSPNEVREMLGVRDA
jgi:hypothetical protein